MDNFEKCDKWYLNYPIIASRHKHRCPKCHGELIKVYS